MRYMQIRPTDIANGPGVRVTLFVSGCRLHCEGCFNKEAWDFKAGYEFNQETINRILDYMDNPFITGLTLLGGDSLEPANQKDTVNLLKQVREKFGNTKDIWVWTGRTWKELQKENYNKYKIDKDPEYKNYSYVPNVTEEFLSLIDILVDGPFVQRLNRKGLVYSGSINQKIIDVPKSLEQGQLVLSKYDYLENRT